MHKIRIRQTLTEKEVEKLCNLHIHHVQNKTSEGNMKDIYAKAIHLFFRNEPRIRHNMEQLEREHCTERPVAFIRTKSEGSAGKAIGRHFRTHDPPETATCCVGSTVTLEGRNIRPQWGLHNGAIGYISMKWFLKKDLIQTMVLYHCF